MKQVAERSYCGDWVVWCALCSADAGFHQTEQAAIDAASEQGYAVAESGHTPVCAACRHLMFDAQPIRTA